MELYADEDFSQDIVLELERLRHDIIRAQKDGFSGEDDHTILTRAHQFGRPCLTHNRRHFVRLDRQGARITVSSSSPSPTASPWQWRPASTPSSPAAHPAAGLFASTARTS